MSTIAERVRERRQALGLSQSELARRCGEKPQTIQKLEAGQVRRPRYLMELARALGSSQEWLAHGVGKPQSQIDSAPKNHLPSVHQSPATTEPVLEGLPRDVPVLGTAQGGPAGSFMMSDSPIDYLRRPPALAGARDLYAVYVIDDSMAPRYLHGEPVFVHPNRPVKPGDYVVVQTRVRDGGEILSFVKKLRRRTEKWLILEQHNPHAEMKIKTSTVVAIHKVLSWSELWGI